MLVKYLRQALHLYTYHTLSSPILTKAVTSLSLFALGDIFAQLLEKKGQFDKLRTFRIALYALIFVGPVSHYWYRLLDNIVEKRIKIFSREAIFLKIAFDQFLYTPPMTVVFFGYMALASGGSIVNAITDVQSKVFPTLKVNWMVWPLVHTVTFGVVPLEYRVLFISVVAVFWACFLSLASAKPS